MYLEEEYYVGFTNCSEIMEMDKNENNTNSVLFHFLASRIYFREARKRKETKRMFYIMSKVSDTIKPQ